MNDVNPYKNPPKHASKSDKAIWNSLRKQWELNRKNNARLYIGAKVIFTQDTKLIAYKKHTHLYLIDKDTSATIIPSYHLLIRLDNDADAYKNKGFYCYYLEGFHINDILPGFLTM